MKRNSLSTSANSIAVCCAVGFAVLVSLESASIGWQTSASGTGKAVRVQVTKPTLRAVTRELKTPATLRADEQVDLLAKVSGYVEKVSVDIGDRVAKGDVLVQLAIPEMADEIRQAQAMHRAAQSRVYALEAKATQASRSVDTAKAQVRQYEAEHELDQLNLDRKKALREGNAIPQQAMDEALSAHTITEAKLAIAHAQVKGAEAQYQAVQADVEVAKSDVMVAQAKISRLKTMEGYASVRAPFDGTVVMRGVDHGAFVRSAADGETTALLRVAKTDSLRIVLEIPQYDASYVRKGTPVRVHLSELGDKPILATVTRTAGALNPMTRTMRAEVDLDNKEGKLAPGMFAHVIVELSSKNQAMAIPSKALRVVEGSSVVYVCINEVVATKPVQVGYDDGIWAEVLTGLEESDRVITSTGGTISPGTPVRSFLTEDS